MAGIERHERRIGIDPQPARDYSVERVADVGPSIGRFGQRLLNAFEPQLQKRAQDAGIKAAGSAAIVRNSEGDWVRPENPKGGGLVYAEAFDRTVDQLYVTKVQTDLDDTLSGLANEHALDPEAYKAAAVGYAQGVLEHVDPRHRATVDNFLTREVSERYRGLALEKTNRDLRNAITGTREQIQTITARAAKIWKAGGPDAERLGTEEMEKVKPLYANLVELQALNPEAAKAMEEQGWLATTDEAELAAAHGTMKVLSGRLGIEEGKEGSLTDMQLSYLLNVAQAPNVPVDPKQFGWDQDPYAGVTSITAKQQLGRMASDVLNKRVADRAAAEQQRRWEEDHKTQQESVIKTSELIAAVKAQNYKPEQGYTQDQVAAMEVERTTHGNTHERLRTGTGRQQELAWIGQTGYVPMGTKEWVEGQMMSGNIAPVVAYVNNMRNVVSGRGKYAVGEVFYQQLPENTRRAIEYFNLASRTGSVPPNAAELVRKTMTGDGVLTPMDAQMKLGKTYANQRAGSLMSAFGLQGTKGAFSAIDANAQITRDFDRALPFFMGLYPGDTRKAVDMTAQAVASSYAPNELFFGGFAPKTFARSGIGNYQINQLPQVTNAQVNPTGARAGQKTRDGHSRVIITPMNGTQQGGYGKYAMTFYTESGRPAGNVTVDFDATFQQMGGIPREPAMAVPRGHGSANAPFQLVTLRNGKVAYRTREWIAAHPHELKQQGK